MWRATILSSVGPLLAHLQLEKLSGRLTSPCLVVAPTSTLPNWAREANRFVPDLNGDRKPDILWRRDTGEDYVWFMDGTATAGGAYLPAVLDPSWKVVPADF